MPRSFEEFQKLKYENPDWDKYKSEFRAINADANQFEDYKRILGDSRLPKSIDKFRDLKYNGFGDYKLLERDYTNEVRAVAFRNRISGDDINLAVRRQKQQDHILGSSEWHRRVRQSAEIGAPLEGAFYRDVDVQKLITDNAGKGLIKFRGNDYYPREYFNTDGIVGIAYDNKAKRYIKSNRVAIHYGAKGTHAYPVIDLQGR